MIFLGYFKTNGQSVNPTADSSKLIIIQGKNNFIKSIDLTPEKSMYDIKSISKIKLDLKYSSSDNFMHKKLYPKIRTTYLRKRTLTNLYNAEQEFLKKNLTLKIWDAYRPYSVTKKMWDEIKDERYVADPKLGSGHNRGIAVDLTLIDLETGNELNMGTSFDNFTDTAHSDFKYLPVDVLSNRKLLRDVMESNGFKNLPTEWWHFFIPNIDKDEVLDLSFRDLRNISGKFIFPKKPKDLQ